MMLGFLGVVALGQIPPQLPNNPVFDLMRPLLKGRWEGVVEKKVKVRFTFHIDKNSGLLVADGLINADSPHPLTARTTLGWDDEAKQVYYLDQHGGDSVYFGHVTREGDELVYDFRGLVGDTGHYRSRERIMGDEYTAEMSAEKDGKWVDVGFHLRLKRVQ